MSADPEVDVSVDFDGESAVARVVERRQLSIDDLFVDGDLRLWEDEHGWEGYVEADDEAPEEYLYVDTREQVDWLRKQPASSETVQRAIERHIADPDAGEAGVFERGCSP